MVTNYNFGWPTRPESAKNFALRRVTAARWFSVGRSCRVRPFAANTHPLVAPGRSDPLAKLNRVNGVASTRATQTQKLKLGVRTRGAFLRNGTPSSTITISSN